MKVKSVEMQLKTKGEIEIIDLTPKIRKVVEESEIKNGVAVVFTPGSTAAITTIEYEPNLEEDLKELLRRIAPKNGWRHPINAHSHLRATILSPSLTVPIINGKLALGTWQQIVFLELDTRPRNRRVIVQLIGN
ncbi:MAG: secondary thiamine-phosphate synthase enzyme YjbQ [archaeon GB-1867-005]|nr:secondary thiamine-phosphate synthase enzyme YjbQ [Candidatus Culexmicrobium cathedralense]